MADVDIGPFGEHESRPEEPTDEHIPLSPAGGGSTWEPEHEQETSFGGEASEKLLLKFWTKTPHWLKRFELCLENKEL